MPRRTESLMPTTVSSSDQSPPLSDSTKRKAPLADGDRGGGDGVPVEQTLELSKRPKTDGPPAAPPATGDPTEVIAAHARTAAAYIPFLEPDSLMAPKLPTKEEMENVLPELRKRALVDEYFGN